jgi:hypothetical protein
MQKHTRIYFDFFGYDDTDFIPSEISGRRAVDLHHIDARGMGGSKERDSIFNLIALTREEHEEYGDKKEFKDFLRFKHFNYILSRRPDAIYSGDYPELQKYADELLKEDVGLGNVIKEISGKFKFDPKRGLSLKP